MTVPALIRRASPRAHRRAALAQPVVAVEFRARDGRTWRAIGGGDTLADAIVFAQASCPIDGAWELVGWADLNGD